MLGATGFGLAGVQPLIEIGLASLSEDQAAEKLSTKSLNHESE